MFFICLNEVSAYNKHFMDISKIDGFTNKLIVLHIIMNETLEIFAIVRLCRTCILDKQVNMIRCKMSITVVLRPTRQHCASVVCILSWVQCWQAQYIFICSCYLCIYITGVCDICDWYVLVISNPKQIK